MGQTIHVLFTPLNSHLSLDCILLQKNLLIIFTVHIFRLHIFPVVSTCTEINQDLSTDFSEALERVHWDPVSLSLILYCTHHHNMLVTKKEEMGGKKQIANEQLMK